jgi:hypothetical protein
VRPVGHCSHSRTSTSGRGTPTSGRGWVSVVTRGVPHEGSRVGKLCIAYSPPDKGAEGSDLVVVLAWESTAAAVVAF